MFPLTGLIIIDNLWLVSCKQSDIYSLKSNFVHSKTNRPVETKNEIADIMYTVDNLWDVCAADLCPYDYYPLSAFTNFQHVLLASLHCMTLKEERFW